MPELKPFAFSPADVLGALALEAERICGAAKLHAHGGLFPDPRLIAGTLARMNELNQILLDHKQEQEIASKENVTVN
jgi:hypothetical protein